MYNSNDYYENNQLLDFNLLNFQHLYLHLYNSM